MTHRAIVRWFVILELAAVLAVLAAFAVFAFREPESIEPTRPYATCEDRAAWGG